MDLFRDLEVSKNNFPKQTLCNSLNYTKLMWKVLADIPAWIRGCVRNLYFSLGLNKKQINMVLFLMPKTESMQKDSCCMGFKEVWSMAFTVSYVSGAAWYLGALSWAFLEPLCFPWTRHCKLSFTSESVLGLLERITEPTFHTSTST